MLRVLLVRSDELVVKVKIDAISGVELAGGGEILQTQRVHLLVHVEGAGLLLAALVGDAVLDAVAAAQVAPEHRREHVAMGGSCFGHAAPSGVLVNYGSQSTAVKNIENGEKSPERVMSSDLNCIFAMSELAYIVDLASTSLGEISDIINPW